ncbi:MAG: T9SS type A sorting domain-containing protein [Saprospiraceae bacterium]
MNVTDGGNRLYLDDIQINGGLVTATDEPGQYGLPLRLFPNPAFDRVQVRADEGWDEPMHIRVFDSLGRLLRDYGADAASTLDLTGLPNGLLFVKIESAGRIATFRLMKKK